MSVAEDTTQIPVPIPEVIAAIVNDLQSTISNTLEAQLTSVSETPKLVETTTKTILKESQSVIDETTKLIDNITSIMADKNEPTKSIVDTKSIMSEGQAIVDETTKLVESAVKTAENIASIVSEEEKRLTETISRLSVDMEQEVKKATGLLAKIHKIVKLIMSCIHRADKSVEKVSTADVDVKVANVV